MRTYMPVIAVALFAIPTPVFSQSGHPYYNRYEGLYNRYDESGRCRELEQLAHTKKNKVSKEWVVAAGVVNFATS
jgi:hypothetical protein